MESECFLRVVLGRFDHIALTGTPRYRPINVLRTLDSLPFGGSVN